MLLTVSSQPRPLGLVLMGSQRQYIWTKPCYSCSMSKTNERWYDGWYKMFDDGLIDDDWVADESCKYPREIEWQIKWRFYDFILNL